MGSHRIGAKIRNSNWKKNQKKNSNKYKFKRIELYRKKNKNNKLLSNKKKYHNRILICYMLKGAQIREKLNLFTNPQRKKTNSYNF